MLNEFRMYPENGQKSSRKHPNPEKLPEFQASCRNCRFACYKYAESDAGIFCLGPIYRRAAQAGHGDAACNLAQMYGLGRGRALQIMHATSDHRFLT